MSTEIQYRVINYMCTFRLRPFPGVCSSPLDSIKRNITAAAHSGVLVNSLLCADSYGQTVHFQHDSVPIHKAVSISLWDCEEPGHPPSSSTFTKFTGEQWMLLAVSAAYSCPRLWNEMLSTLTWFQTRKRLPIMWLPLTRAHLSHRLEPSSNFL